MRRTRKNGDKTLTLNYWENLKTEISTKILNSNCNNKNSNTKIVNKIVLWKLKKIYCDKSQKLWQIYKFNLWKKLKCDITPKTTILKPQIATKLKHSKCDKTQKNQTRTQKLKLWHNSKT